MGTSKDEESLVSFENALTQIGKKISFRGCMGKMKKTLNSTMRGKKKIKLGDKKNKMLAAEWVDEELIRNIRLRTYYSSVWRIARKNKSPPEIIEKYKERYLKQQHLTSIMSGDKKSQWEQKKIEET